MIDIKQVDITHIKEFINNHRYPSYRAEQIWNWIWINKVNSFNEMKNLPKTLIKDLSDNYNFLPIFINKEFFSTDKTIKVSFKLFDNNFVEGVIIPSENRLTACLSTQVGCPLNCSFCATGHFGFQRNLNTGEIFDQVVLLNNISKKKFNKTISNIVLMGMGEPFLNYNNVCSALNKLCLDKGLNYSASKITVSTIGFPEKILTYANEKRPWSLAISLHSAIEEKRNELIPASKKYKLSDLQNSLKQFCKISGKKITIEYLMLKNINDGKDDLKALINFCSKIPSKVNLINYNPVPELKYEKSDLNTINYFQTELNNKNITSIIRKSMGNDILAACGQLANKVNFEK